MERYLLEEKDGTYAEIYCHNGNLVFDSVKAEILRLGVSKYGHCAEQTETILFFTATAKTDFLRR